MAEVTTSLSDKGIDKVDKFILKKHFIESLYHPVKAKAYFFTYNINPDIRSAITAKLDAANVKLVCGGIPKPKKKWNSGLTLKK